MTDVHSVSLRSFIVQTLILCIGIPLTEFLCFNKLKKLTQDVAVMASALSKHSTQLKVLLDDSNFNAFSNCREKVSKDGKAVERITPFLGVSDDVDERTIYVVCSSSIF
jgi:hypothetical protein